MKKFKSLLLLLAGMFLASPTFAQANESAWFANLQSMDPTQLTLLVILGVVLGIIVLLLVLLIYLMTFMSAVFKKENPGIASQPSWWDEFKIKYVTGKMKPVGGKEEKEKMLDHTYDGIVELDNHMPPWLANVFFLTIGIGVVYFMYYTVLGIGPTQLEEYAEEHRIAAIQIEEYKALAVSNIDETTVVFDETPATIAAGQSIYSANCVACHAADGGGGVGSNLTDEFWKHGGSINDIFKVIKYGVVEKGMIPWQDQLSPEQMQQVASFIKTLQGTTPANPKEAEGERYVPGGVVEPAKTDSVAVPVVVEAVAEVK